MGLKIEIEYRPHQKALKAPDYKIAEYRKDNIFAMISQTEKGEPIHMVCYNTTSSMKRANNWARLKRRRLVRDMLKNFGLITTIKYLLY